MYELYFGLNEKPFNLTPDPRFLFLSVKHQEAYAHLLYGIRNRSGFVMVTGEIGTGKTIICRSLLRELDSDTEIAFIFNPKLTPGELMRTIISDFGIESSAQTLTGLNEELNKYLLDQSARGKNCVLIIDEAQNLEAETLEQVRLLSNLETETEKLVQIVLIGQPELQEKLKLTELRQLDQRITARYQLMALNRKETLKYIVFRLRVAGARNRVRFTRGASQRVYRYSKGTPRVINAICDRALLVGYTKESSVITARMVKQAAREVKGDHATHRDPIEVQDLLPATVVAGWVVLVLFVLVILASSPIPSLSDVGGFARGGWQRLVGSTEMPEPGPTSGSGPEEARSEGEGIFASEAMAGETVESASVSVDGDATVGNRRQSSSNVVEAASRSGLELAASQRAEFVTAKATPKVLETSTGSEQTLGPEREVEEAPRPKPVVGGISPLLLAWGLPELSAASPNDSIRGVQRFSATHGLSFVRHELSLKQIATINLPALARVTREGEQGWVAILSLKDDNVIVSFAEGDDEDLSTAQFEQMYSGEVAYVWDSSAAELAILRAQSTGSKVQALQGDLRTLGLLSREPTGVYDAATIDVVSKIQRATGLSVDGIVGPQTRMVIENWLGSLEAPALIKPVFSDAARAQVLSSRGMVVASRSGGNMARELEPPRAAKSELVPSPKAEDPEPSGGDILPAEGFEPLEPLEEDTEEIVAGPLDEKVAQGIAASEESVWDGAAVVSVEQLGGPGYRPQLEEGLKLSEGSVTPSAGSIVPIVPRDGER